MSRNLLQMTKTIFSELESAVKEEHKDFIVESERHININSSYKDECCEFLKNAKMIGVNKQFPFTIVFIEYEQKRYIGIDSRYAEKLERYGYVVESDLWLTIGTHLLCISKKYERVKVNSDAIIKYCLGIEPEEGKSSIVFSDIEILKMIFDITVLNLERNDLSLSMDFQQDLWRIFIIIYGEESKRGDASLLVNLASRTNSRKISVNLVDYINIDDNKIKFLTLYQCIEYLFIPNRAQEFKANYNMDIIDATRLHMKEPMRRDEKANLISVLKNLSDEIAIDNFFRKVCIGDEDSNKIEKVASYIYNLRCTIAHFRYGQTKENLVSNWEEMLIQMLMLLDNIYGNICADIQKLCNGSLEIQS